MVLSKAPFEVTWDFGDGSNFTGPSVSGHVYETIGNFTVSVSVVADYSIVETEARLSIRTFQRECTYHIMSMLCNSAHACSGMLAYPNFWHI